jgi:hypothetical protein
MDNEIVEALILMSRLEDFGFTEHHRHTLTSAADAIAAKDARIAELEQIERNRDMWEGQCERQAVALTEAHAEVRRLKGKEERLKNTLHMSHHYWLLAAKEALRGDLGKLRNHVAIAEGKTRDDVIADMEARAALDASHEG